MPCICYGAITGKEDYDKFLESTEGKLVMKNLRDTAACIKSHAIDVEVIDMNDIEFRQMFVKAFLHMLVGCDENGLPKK